MCKLLPVAAAVGLIVGNPVNAAGFDLSLSNETANIEVFSPLPMINEGGQLTIGVFYNDLDDVIVHGKMVAVGTQTNTRVPYQLACLAGECSSSKFVALWRRGSSRVPCRVAPRTLSAGSWFRGRARVLYPLACIAAECSAPSSLARGRVAPVV